MTNDDNEESNDSHERNLFTYANYFNVPKRK